MSAIKISDVNAQNDRHALRWVFRGRSIGFILKKDMI